MHTRLNCLTIVIPLISACSHLSLDPGNASYGLVEDVRSKRSSTWDWIRIELIYDKSVNELTTLRQTTLKRLISQARDYFEDTIKVERVRKLQLWPECAGQMWKKDNKGEVTIVCEKYCRPSCGTATAPMGTAIFTPCSCHHGNCPSDFDDYIGTITHTDFVLFVAIRHGICAKNTLAYAARCSLHPITHRPISGYVNVCPDAFDAMQKNEMSRWLSTIKHELIHAFVFSTSHYRNFIGAKPEVQKTPIPIVPGVIEKFTRTDWEVAQGNIPHDVYMIVTPKVRQEARNHFACPTLEGAEVENQGGSGTRGAHWEKRVFENEAMSGVATQVYAVSRLTLALFEDSGWYQVNYDKAEDMSWGKGLGCDFAKKSCLTWMRSRQDPYPFCTQEFDMRCSEDRKSKVSCNLVSPKFARIPIDYNYNIPSLYTDDNGGRIVALGQEEVADYCPYYRVFGEVAKEATDTRCTYAGNMYYNNYSLEIFSRSARCFSLDGGIKVSKKLKKTTYNHKVGCYETVCKEDRLYVKMQSSKFYPCYYAGQFIHVEKRIPKLGKVTTRIICPPCKDICGEKCAPDKKHNEKIGDYRKISTSLAIFFSFIVLLMFFL
ncbi:unnamed protein product [Cylicocyclus nassatus]|uniref:Leishmanolysin-like peptidase n=1 Tax=Cylicocyclus nassatus TaxID=53992 RepID=A0AA36DMR8_CYLNA|nr:unnamed protein product [Cylicocyclus nassatus]